MRSRMVRPSRIFPDASPPNPGQCSRVSAVHLDPMEQFVAPDTLTTDQRIGKLHDHDRVRRRQTAVRVFVRHVSADRLVDLARLLVQLALGDGGIGSVFRGALQSSVTCTTARSQVPELRRALGRIAAQRHDAAA